MTLAFPDFFHLYPLSSVHTNDTLDLSLNEQIKRENSKETVPRSYALLHPLHLAQHLTTQPNERSLSV